MRKEGFCAYGAQRIEQSISQWMRSCPQGGSEPAFQLQVCLLLFRACYPPRRVAFWKRRLRRFLRAHYALQRHRQLLQWIQSLSPPEEARAGVERVCLRLRQRIAQLEARVEQAHTAVQKAHVLNELKGLSQRWRESFGDEPPCEAYARGVWEQVVREQSSALTALHQPLETRWGRLRTLLHAHELLVPLLGEDPRASEWKQAADALEQALFRHFAHQTLSALQQTELQATEQYFGDTQPFEPLRVGFEFLLTAL